MIPDPEQYANLYRRVIFAFGDGDEAIRLQRPDKLDRLVVVLGCDGRCPYVASALTAHIDGQVRRG